MKPFLNLFSVAFLISLCVVSCSAQQEGKKEEDKYSAKPDLCFFETQILWREGIKDEAKYPTFSGLIFEENVLPADPELIASTYDKGHADVLYIVVAKPCEIAKPLAVEYISKLKKESDRNRFDVLGFKEPKVISRDRYENPLPNN